VDAVDWLEAAGTDLPSSVPMRAIPTASTNARTINPATAGLLMCEISYHVSGRGV
jgi:hypothetical protein